MNLPNKLTLTRIILVPVFMIFVSLTGLDGIVDGTFNAAFYLLAGIVFAAASFTDFLDGHLARKWHMVTDFGKFADPLADKLLTTVAFIYMLRDGVCSPVVLCIILAREFAVSGLRMVAAGASSQPCGVLGTVQCHRCHRDAAGHLHGSQQSVQAVHRAALHGDADDRQGGVGGKSTCQMCCHACRAQDDSKAVGLCAFCKGCCLGGCAVCRKDVCLKGDVQCLQLGAGTLDHRPIAVRTHDHCHFTNHFPKPLFLMSNKTDKQKRLRYTCTTAFISSFSVRAFCTRLHHAPDCSECDPIPCDPAPAASLKFPSAVSCASVFSGGDASPFLGASSLC